MIVLDDVERDTRSDFARDEREPATSGYQGDRDDCEGHFEEVPEKRRECLTERYLSLSLFWDVRDR